MTGKQMAFGLWTIEVLPLVHNSIYHGLLLVRQHVVDCYFQHHDQMY